MAGMDLALQSGETPRTRGEARYKGNNMKARILGLVAMGLLAGPLAADATVIYSNFGPGDAFNCCTGWTIDSDNGQGVQFTAGSSGLVTSVDVGMGVAGIPPEAVNFNLYGDSSDNIGALLESFSVIVNNRFGTVATSTGATSGATLLTAGKKYWLIASSPSGVNVPWNLNSIGDTGLLWSNGDVFTDQTLATFRINANPAPEPMSLALLGLGLAGLGLSRRRKAT